MSWTIVWATLGVTALLVIGVGIVAIVTVAGDRKKRETYSIKLGQGRD